MTTVVSDHQRLNGDSLILNIVLHPLSFSILYLRGREGKKGVKRGSMTKQVECLWCSAFVFDRDFETTKETWAKKISWRPCESMTINNGGAALQRTASINITSTYYLIGGAFEHHHSQHVEDTRLELLSLERIRKVFGPVSLAKLTENDEDKNYLVEGRAASTPSRNH
jgi:hypothetical protein